MAQQGESEPVYVHSAEDALEPKHLIRRSDVILRAGALMLGAGTGSRRVKETMRQVGQALDVDRLQTQITLNEIVLTVSRRGIFRTQVAEIPSPGVNADRVAALKTWAGSLPPHMTVKDVQAGLDAIVARPARYPDLVRAVGAGAACAGFAHLNNGAVLEVLGAAVAAFAGQWLRIAMLHRKLNQLAVVFAAAVLACLVYLGASWLGTHVAGLPADRQVAGFTSAVLFLVPGFPLITAALDLARLDLAAGISRLTYAALVTVTAAMGMWGVATVFGLVPTVAPPLPADPWVTLALRLAATFLGVAGFAVVFNSPPRPALAAALIATVANTPRISLVEAGVAPLVAAALATCTIGLVAWYVGAALGLPRIILSVPAVVIMVPGAAAYRALVSFNDGDLLGALDYGISAVLVVLGMALGLAAARMLTDRDWAFVEARPPRRRD